MYTDYAMNFVQIMHNVTYRSRKQINTKVLFQTFHKTTKILDFDRP